MKYIPRILAHAALILTPVLITLLIFDYFNPSMDFINNTMAKAGCLALCVISLINAILLLVATRRR